MQEQTAYTVIHRRLAAGEEPTFSEIIDLLNVDAVAASVFQAGSTATIIYLLQRVSCSETLYPDETAPLLE